MQQPLVLASTSAIRKTLLHRLGLPFVVSPSHVDETPLPNESAYALVQRLSQLKAQSPHVTRQHPGALIIGCDQVAEHQGTILGKPLNHASAMDQLSRCSGQVVTFYSGLCVYNDKTGHAHGIVVPTTVTYRVLSEAQIQHYLSRTKPYHCAGSMCSEEMGMGLIQRLDSTDPCALMGLPLIQLTDVLIEAKMHPLSEA